MLLTQKAKNFLKRLKKENENPFTCLPHTKERDFPPVFNEKCFSGFDQSSCVIYLTWYSVLIFFQEVTSVIPFKSWFLDRTKKAKKGQKF